MVIPRVVIAAPGSGAGKTTLACGLIGALRMRGLRVQPFKVGPDYIDPSHHTLAAGRPGRNLDAFLCGEDLIAPLFLHGAQGADIAVIEGVMGMFDGVSGAGDLASTAHVAKLLDAPVILVIDASKMARSVAAIVHGCVTFDREVHVAGVVLNRVGSDHHEQILREAIRDVKPPTLPTLPVLGALHRDERLTAPERHLGLVPATEIGSRERYALDAVAGLVSEHVDLDAVLALARGAGMLAGWAWSPSPPVDRAAAPPGAASSSTVALPAAGARIAIAAGSAFSFHYRENLELLQATGAELVELDPLQDEHLPEDCCALLLVGGFPEVYGEELACNASLRAEIARFAEERRPVLAECGGLLYLAESLDGRPMCGVLEIEAHMSDRLALGYRHAKAATATPWLASGQEVRGHEFHYCRVEPAHDAKRPAWTLSSAREASAHSANRMATRSAGAAPSLSASGSLPAGGQQWPEGFAVGSIQASFLHVHWAADPDIGWRFAQAAAASASSLR